MVLSDITEFLARRGLDLRQTDVDDVQAMLLLVPVDDALKAEPEIWESVSLIIDDPLYEGDAQLPDSD